MMFFMSLLVEFSSLIFFLWCLQDCLLVRVLYLYCFFILMCFLSVNLAQQDSSHVQPHPPHLATSEPPMVRGNRGDGSPPSSPPQAFRNGSEHFRWAGRSWPLSFFLFFSFMSDAELIKKLVSVQSLLSSLRANCCLFKIWFIILFTMLTQIAAPVGLRISQVLIRTTAFIKNCPLGSLKTHISGWIFVMIKPGNLYLFIWIPFNDH